MVRSWTCKTQVQNRLKDSPVLDLRTRRFKTKTDTFSCQFSVELSKNWTTKKMQGILKYRNLFFDAFRLPENYHKVTNLCHICSPHILAVTLFVIFIFVPWLNGPLNSYSAFFFCHLYILEILFNYKYVVDFTVKNTDLSTTVFDYSWLSNNLCLTIWSVCSRNF